MIPNESREEISAHRTREPRAEGCRKEDDEQVVLGPKKFQGKFQAQFRRDKLCGGLSKSGRRGERRMRLGGVTKDRGEDVLVQNNAEIYRKMLSSGD